MPEVTPAVRSEVGPSLQVFGVSRSGGRLCQYLRRVAVGRITVPGTLCACHRWTGSRPKRHRRSTVKPYILDDASAFEYQRLDLMSKILDPWTRGYLTTVGVAEGWHCLELGGGNGSIAEWLAAKVGASGSVTAIDINRCFSTCSLHRICRCSRWTCAPAS